jgi:plasmid maintenance system killer protein
MYHIVYILHDTGNTSALLLQVYETWLNAIAFRTTEFTCINTTAFKRLQLIKRSSISRNLNAPSSSAHQLLQLDCWSDMLCTQQHTAILSAEIARLSCSLQRPLSADW